MMLSKLAIVLFLSLGLEGAKAFTTPSVINRHLSSPSKYLQRPCSLSLYLAKDGPSTFLPIGELKTHRAGAWLPRDPGFMGVFLEKTRERVAASSDTTLVDCVRELDDFVRSDPALYGNAQAMFYETSTNHSKSVLGAEPVKNWEEFVLLLNYIVQSVAPEFYIKPDSTPYDLIAFPINALLDWPMGTLPGFAVFSNSGFNAKMRRVLTYWTTFLTSEASTYTLTSDSSSNPNFSTAIAWLDPAVRTQLIEKVNSAVNNPRNYSEFQDIFECDPSLPAYGFDSWDSFFTRKFNPAVRPIEDPDDWTKIANAAESAPLQVSRNVKFEDSFWLKNQTYSLKDMIDYGSYQYADSFVGGTVYQAFLSATSFHQWRSPISGKVVASYNIPGTYYLQSYFKGFDESDDGKADPVAPNDSQPYLASTSTRSVIIIESEEEALGTVAFIGIGMGECGSCDNFVKAGETIRKGHPIGTFHYGGSTHCLVFQPNVEIEFIPYIQTEASIKGTRNVAISSTIATIIPSCNGEEGY